MIEAFSGGNMVRAEWAKNETTTFMSVWGERKLQQMLTGAKRNQTMFQTTVDRMAELG